MRGDGSQRPAARAWAWAVAFVGLCLFLGFLSVLVYVALLILGL